MIATKNVRQFFQPVLEALYATLHLPASVWLAEEGGEILRIVAAVQLPEAYSQEAYLTLSESLVASRVFASGQTEFIPRIADEPAWKYKAEAAEEGLVAALVAPVCRKTKPIGVLDVYTPRAEGFTAAEREVVEAFANEVAVAANYFQGLDLVSDVSLLLSSELHPETLFEQIMLAAHKVLECEHVSLFALNADGSLERKASSSAGIVRRHFAPGQGLAGKVAQTGRSELVRNARQHPNFVPGQSPNDPVERSLLVVPIQQDSQVIGVISADKDGLNGFDDHDQTLLESVAQQAAVAFHNAELFQRETRQRQQAETLQEIARIVSSAQKREDVIAAILEQLRKVIDYASASVQLFQGEHRILGGGAPAADPWLHRDISEDELVREIVERRAPRVISDVSQEKRWQVLPATEHVKSWIGAPLIVNDQVIGLLTIDHAQPGYYTEESGKLAMAFASQVAVALQHSAQATALTKLNQVAQNLVALGGSAGDTRRLLSQIAQSALEVLQADLIELYEYVQSKDAYTLPQITAGVRRSKAQPAKDKIYEDDAVYHLIRRVEPTYVADSQAYSIISGEYQVDRADRPKERFAVREGIRSTAAIPLRVGDEPVGLMFVNYRIPQKFPPEQRELAELFARQAAIAIRNARRVRALGVLNGLGSKLASRLEENAILELIHEQANELMDTDNIYVALYEADPSHPDDYNAAKPDRSQIYGTLRFGLALDDGRRRDLPPRRGGKGRAEAIIRARQPLLIRSKAEAKAWYAEPGREDYQKREFASWAGVPMLVADKVVGVIATHHPEKENLYTQDDVAMLQAIASQAAVALENARLFYGVNRQLEGLVGFGKKVTSSIRLTEAEILKFIHEQAHALMDTNNMYIALYDDARDEVRFGLAFKDGAPIQVASRTIDDRRRGRTEEIIRTKKPLFIPTLAESLAWYQAPGHAEFIGNALASWIGVPIKLGEKVLGVIATYHPTQDYVYSPSDLEILQGIGEQAAVALENARVYQQLEAAHKKIAEQAAIVTRTNIAIDFVHRLNNLAGTIPIWADQARAYLQDKGWLDDEIADYLDTIIADARGLLRAGELLKSPPSPENTDITSVLNSLVRQVRVQMPAAIKVSLETQPALPPVFSVATDLSNALWGIIENGIDAMPDGGRLEISASKAPDTAGQAWISIQIRDEGQGIAPDELDHVFMPFYSTKPGHMGYGLWRSREVIERLGGTIRLESTVGQGTVFTVALPGSLEAKSNGR